MTYLDFNSTTPVDKRVLAAMLPYFEEEFANPASDHVSGLSAKEAVDKARLEMGRFIGAKTDEIIFTGGATEANNLALIGLATKDSKNRKHIITSRIEHPAILRPAEYLASLGFRITYVSVDRFGFVDIDDIRRHITSDTLLISIMTANNEIGTIEPIEAIGSLARDNGVYFHTDAAQAVGHIPINVDRMNIDLMSVSGHKFYGPKGIGCLFVRNRIPRVRLNPIIYGGGQERGLRSGTLNVPGIIGMAEACRLARREMRQNSERQRLLISRLLRNIREKRTDISINGPEEARLAHTINIEIPHIDNKWLMMKLKDICFSTGSACSVFHDEPSHVLLAIGLSQSRVNSSIRIGIGNNTTEADIDDFTNKLSKLL